MINALVGYLGLAVLGWVLVALPGTVVDENNPPTPSPSPQ